MSITQQSRRRRRKADVHERRLYQLILLAAALSIGHHIDHAIRGNQVGWPLTPELNAFTYSLAIYPIILTGLALFRWGKVGPRFWFFVSSGGALFVAAIHFGPTAVEPPADIITMYQPRLLGWLAFGWLVLLVAALIAASFYELWLWRRHPSSSRESALPTSADSNP